MSYSNHFQHHRELIFSAETAARAQQQAYLMVSPQHLVQQVPSHILQQYSEPKNGKVQPPPQQNSRRTQSIQIMIPKTTTSANSTTNSTTQQRVTPSSGGTMPFQSLNNHVFSSGGGRGPPTQQQQQQQPAGVTPLYNCQTPQNNNNGRTSGSNSDFVNKQQAPPAAVQYSNSSAAAMQQTAMVPQLRLDQQTISSSHLQQQQQQPQHQGYNIPNCQVAQSNQFDNQNRVGGSSGSQSITALQQQSFERQHQQYNQGRRPQSCQAIGSSQTAYNGTGGIAHQQNSFQPSQKVAMVTTAPQTQTTQQFQQFQQLDGATATSQIGARSMLSEQYVASQGGEPPKVMYSRRQPPQRDNQQLKAASQPQQFIFPESSSRTNDPYNHNMQYQQQRAHSNYQRLNPAADDCLDMSRLTVPHEDFNNSRFSTQHQPVRKIANLDMNKSWDGPGVILGGDQQPCQNAAYASQSFIHQPKCILDDTSELHQQPLGDLNNGGQAQAQILSPMYVVGGDGAKNGHGQPFPLITSQSLGYNNAIRGKINATVMTPQRADFRQPLGSMGCQLIRDGNSSYTTDRQTSFYEKNTGVKDVSMLGLNGSFTSVVNGGGGVGGSQQEQSGHRSLTGIQSQSKSPVNKFELYQIKIDEKTSESNPSPCLRLIEEKNEASSGSRPNVTESTKKKRSEGTSRGLPTATLELSYSHENTTTMQHNLNTTMVNGLANNFKNQAAQNEIVFLTSSKTSFSCASNNFSAQNTATGTKPVEVKTPRTSTDNNQNVQQTTSYFAHEETKQKKDETSQKSKDSLSNGDGLASKDPILSVTSDEFKRELFKQIKQAQDAMSKSMILEDTTKCDVFEDPMGCNLGSNISTQRSHESKADEGSKNLESSPITPSSSLIQQKHPQKGSFSNMVGAGLQQPGGTTSMPPMNQQSKAQTKSSLAMSPTQRDKANGGMANLKMHVAQTPQTVSNSDECSSDDGSSEAESSLSIYGKFPNLPTQLKEIVELQNFRIKNMQVEVNTLKDENLTYKEAMEEQKKIKVELAEQATANQELRQMLHQQQSQHMAEMDQVCGQIGPMMEALKLLFCEVTEMNNLDELMNEETPGTAIAFSGIEDQSQSRLERNKNLALSKSLLQLKNAYLSSPKLDNSVCVSTNKSQLRLLQQVLKTARSEQSRKISTLKVSKKKIIIEDQCFDSEVQHHKEHFIMTSQGQQQYIQSMTHQVVETSSRHCLSTPPNHAEAHLTPKPKVVGSEEVTQNVENFTEEGDFILTDEADIPESARTNTQMVQAPLFCYKNKSEIESTGDNHNVQDHSSIVAESQNNSNLQAGQFQQPGWPAKNATDKQTIQGCTSITKRSFVSSSKRHGFLSSILGGYPSTVGGGVEESKRSNGMSDTEMDIRLDDIKIDESHLSKKFISHPKKPQQKSQLPLVPIQGFKVNSKSDLRQRNMEFSKVNHPVTAAGRIDSLQQNQCQVKPKPSYFADEKSNQNTNTQTGTPQTAIRKTSTRRRCTGSSMSEQVLFKPTSEVNQTLQNSEQGVFPFTDQLNSIAGSPYVFVPSTTQSPAEVVQQAHHDPRRQTPDNAYSHHHQGLHLGQHHQPRMQSNQKEMQSAVASGSSQRKGISLSRLIGGSGQPHHQVQISGGTFEQGWQPGQRRH